MRATHATELGPLPVDWAVERFDYLFSVQQGKQVSKKSRIGNNQHPFLRTKNIAWGCIDLSELDAMNFTDSEEEKLALMPGDLLVCEGGDIGRTAIWESDLTHCYYQNHLHRARLKMDNAHPKFILYWLWYAFEVEHVYFGRGNVTTIPNLSQSKLCELPIPVPPLHEQKKIAAVLSAVQLAIEQQEKLIALTTELKKTLMHKLFTEGLRGEKQKMTEIGPVPESWDVVELGNCLTKAQYGLSVKGVEGGKYALLRMINQQNGQIIGSNLQYVDLSQDQFKNLRLERADILFNRTNSFDLVGRTAIFDIEGDYAFASYLIRLRCDASRLYPHFLNHYFNWDKTQQRLKSIATRAVSQSNISATRLRGFAVPLPSLKEQDEIIADIDEIDRKYKMHIEKKSLLENLFQTLLHQLMTARIRVNDLDIGSCKNPHPNPLP